MTRTLADMTPDERQECVGRWAEARRHLVIITEIDEQRGDAYAFRVETSTSEWHLLQDLTPRLDLPRAWTPDGEPFLAGAEALDTLRRVRDVVTDLRDQREAALQRWDDTGDPWDGAASDILHDTIHLLTEALKGEHE